MAAFQVKPRRAVVEAIFVEVADLLPAGRIVAIGAVAAKRPVVRIFVAGRAVGKGQSLELHK